MAIVIILGALCLLIGGAFFLSGNNSQGLSCGSAMFLPLGVVLLLIALGGWLL